MEKYLSEDIEITSDSCQFILSWLFWPPNPKIIDLFQHHQWISERPVAGDYPEDVHLQPHAGPASLHHSHGVHEKERAGRYRHHACKPTPAHTYTVKSLFVDRCRKRNYLSNLCWNCCIQRPFSSHQSFFTPSCSAVENKKKKKEKEREQH